MSRIRSFLTSAAAAAAALSLALAGTAPASADAPSPGSTITGTVTAAGGGPLTQPVVVSAQQDGYNSNWISYADAATGEYSIDGLPPGSYLIVFMPVVSDIWSPQYREQLYDGVYQEALATRIEITADGQTFAHIDAAMEYVKTDQPVNPVDALPCVDPRDPRAVRALVRQFADAGGSVKQLTRADIRSYLLRCV